VVDTNDRLIGRVTVDAVLDFVRERGHGEVLAQATARGGGYFRLGLPLVSQPLGVARHQPVDGLRGSRVIGVFETIEKLVALAALMPIVAGIGGARQQTTTMLVRAIALGQVSREHSMADQQGAAGRAAEQARLGRRDRAGHGAVYAISHGRRHGVR
jgi:magnesium transporter